MNYKFLLQLIYVSFLSLVVWGLLLLAYTSVNLK